MIYIAFALAFIFNCAGNFPDLNDPKTGFPLAYEQDFEDPLSMNSFEFPDPEPWFLTSGKGGGLALEFAGKGNYETKVRSPFIIGLISGMSFGDFVLEADVLQTGREYGHRDMCLFFNFSDSAKFYYVHLASVADPHAHNVFIVNEKPRTAIADQTTDGIRWINDHWHRIRIERITSEGSIRVYFDDLDAPVMIASDKTFQSGLIGFGSFDDSGKIDNIKIWSADASKTDLELFSKKNP